MVFAWIFLKSKSRELMSSEMAEKEGFEPPVPCGTAVFKTAAFGHSAISPHKESKN